MANNVNVKKLEADLWESADLLRAGSKLTSNQYCMPVLGLIFLRYAYSRFKLVEQEILKDRPMRGGRVLPVEQSDFAEKSALFLPKEAQYNYLVNLPANIPEQGLTGIEGNPLNSLGEVVNNAMELVEQQSEQLQGVLPKDYTIFSDELLGELLRIFNNDALDDVGGDVIGRIYEYFLNKFAKNVAQDDGVFFTPKSLVKMIVNVLEPAPYSSDRALRCTPPFPVRKTSWCCWRSCPHGLQSRRSAQTYRRCRKPGPVERRGQAPAH